MKHKSITLQVIVFLTVIMAIFSFGVFGFIFLDRPITDIPDSSAPVLFSVAHGTSLLTIVHNLQDQALIPSAQFAYFYARIFDLSLKAGTYKLSREMSTSTILRYIAAGKQEYIRVTVPEGLSILKTARHLAAAGLVSEESFLEAARNPSVLERYGIIGKTTEGFLFPDTYFFPYKADPETLVNTMVTNFFKKTSDMPNLPDEPAELYRKVILASIVEREYRVAGEAPRIASVFINRLAIGMGLQSCATIEYIITEIQHKPHPLRLSVEDLGIQNDYNTYLWAGLPPGPISNPGLVALSAAFNPEATKFLYFRLTDPTAGTHSFTSSLDQHVQVGRQLVLKSTAGDE